MPFTFDANDWPIVPARSFAELKVGEIFRAPSRTLTDAHASAFQAVSCDNHPIHYDVGYARRYGHSAPVVHGLQVLAFTAPARPCCRIILERSLSPSPNCPPGS